jgi:hypothetical protein
MISELGISYPLKAVESLCRCAPELAAGVLFFLRRRKVDSVQSETLLREFGVSEATINYHRELLDDLVDFEAVKKDWDGAWLSCVLSYVVLLFVVPIGIAGFGLMCWLVAFIWVRQTTSDVRPGDRYRSRRLISFWFWLLIVLSMMAKISTVYFRTTQS